MDKHTIYKQLMQDTPRVRQLVLDIQSVFTDLMPGAVWFIHAGTALGAHLHNGVLPGDHDIDIGVLAETCPLEEYRAALMRKGFRGIGVFHAAEGKDLGLATWASKYGLCFDTSWFYLREQKINSLGKELLIRKRWWLTSPRVPHVLPAYLFDSPQAVGFEGLMLPAPHPLRVYCDNRWPSVDGKYPGPEQGGERLEIFPDWEIR